MRGRLLELWQARGKREKQFLLALAVVLLLLAYAWLLAAAGSGRRELSASVLSLHTEASRLERDAQEIASLRQRAPAKIVPPTPLGRMIYPGLVGPHR